MNARALAKHKYHEPTKEELFAIEDEYKQGQV